MNYEGFLYSYILLTYIRITNELAKLKSTHIGVLSIIIQIKSNFTLHKQQNESHE